jgi:hypothetical protein
LQFELIATEPTTTVDANTDAPRRAPKPISWSSPLVKLDTTPNVSGAALPIARKVTPTKMTIQILFEYEHKVEK